MRKTFIILLVIFSSLSLSAQKIHFTDSSNVWYMAHVDFENGSPMYSYYDDYYIGDAVINSKTYKIMQSGWYNPTCTGCPGAYFREDTILNKVFVLINDSEQILMDYNLNIGDTISHEDMYNEVSTYFVSSIDSIMINSLYYKVWQFTSIYSSTTGWVWNYYVVEGVGSTNGPLFVTYPLEFESIEELDCFYNSGNPPVSPVVSYDGVVTFDNQTSCTAGINTVSKTTLEYSIFPNPATTYLTIQSTNIINKITITNLLGQTIYSNQYNAEQVQVDVSGFPAGGYFVKVNGVEVRKFVKE